MGSGAGLRIHRRLFLATDAVFFVLGFVFMVVGVHLYTAQHSLSGLAPSSYSAMSTAGLCVCAGCMSMVVAVIGCGAVSVQSRWLMAVYIGFVLLIFLVLFLTGIIGFLHDEIARERVKHSLYSTINRTFVTEYGPESNFRITWDYMQETLHCCGVESFEDWHNAARWPKNKFVPDSCCDKTHFAANESFENCGKSGHQRFIFPEGCYESFANWLLHHLHVIKVFSILFAVVQICLLAISLKLVVEFGRLSPATQPAYRYARGNRGDDKLIQQNGF